MSPIRVGLTAALALISSFGLAQIDHVTIAAGTPEDKDLTTIGNEQDLQKKILKRTRLRKGRAKCFY